MPRPLAEQNTRGARSGVHQNNVAWLHAVRPPYEVLHRQPFEHRGGDDAVIEMVQGSRHLEEIRGGVIAHLAIGAVGR